MANPFLGETQSSHTPSAVNDHYGDSFFHDTAPLHVAGLLFLALMVIVGFNLLGLRAVVGIGRS